MAKLFSQNSPKTDLRRNVFDLSERAMYTSPAGLLLPTFCREVNPGEKLELKNHSFTRTMPLNTASNVSLRQYNHCFFVPYSQLWSGWENFIHGVDRKTSAVNDQKKIPFTTPVVDLFKVLASLLAENYEKHKQELGERFKLRSGRVASTIDPLTGLDGFQPFKGHFFIEGDAGVGNLTIGEYSWLVGSDQLGFSLIDNISRKLELLGYNFVIPLADGDVQNGTLSELFKHTLTQLRLKGQFCDEDCSDVSENIDGVIVFNPTPDQLIKAFCKLLKGMHMKINLFRLLAYNKIYSDFYRRDDYERARAVNFNIDDAYSGGDVTNAFAGEATDGVLKRDLEFWTLKYRWLPKDFFTGVVPSELLTDLPVENNSGSLRWANLGVPSDGTYRTFISDNNTPPQTTGFSFQFADGSKRSITIPALTRSYDTTQKINGQELISHGSSTSTDTRSIRIAFALEKMLRLTRRADSRSYVDQIAAHYGFDLRDSRENQVRFIGGNVFDVQISEIVATSATDGAQVGDIAGKGTGSSRSDEIHYTAPEHGIIMMISSIMPSLDYGMMGLNPFNAKMSRGDFFHPEFADLGLQPLHLHSYSYNPFVSSSGNLIFGVNPAPPSGAPLNDAEVYLDEVRFFDLARPLRELKDVMLSPDENLEEYSPWGRFPTNAILGYVPRYEEYKVSFDKLYGNFNRGRSLSAFSAQNLIVADETGIHLDSLRVNPSTLDSIFAVSYDGTQDTDQFICQQINECKIIRPMSYTGQPL